MVAGEWEYLDAFDTESQSGCGADLLPPLHVPWFTDSLTHVFFTGRLIGVYLTHLIVHVLQKSIDTLMNGLGDT